MMKRNILWQAIFFVSCAICVVGCESEIDVDYHHISPKYVMTGSITPDSIIFTLQQTVDVTTSLDEAVELIDANVHVSGSDGTSYTLTRRPSTSNCFVALGNQGELLGGVQGVTYTVEALIGEDVIKGSSTLTAPIDVDDIKFEWVDFIGDNQSLFITCGWQDPIGEENYYHILIKRANGDPYAWDIRSDEGEDGNRIEFIERCMSSEDTPEDDADEYIADGEILTIEMRQINRNTYYYLMSVMVGENSAANPIPFYTGDQYLGYFEAYNPRVYTITYREE